MLFRPQRGSLEDSMKAVITLQPTRRALAEHLGVAENKIMVKPYAMDDRVGWHTHLVTVSACAVGFTDGPLDQ